MAASTEAVGLIAVLIACVFFGSNFVVTKKYKTGDGMMFQLVLTVGIWFVGLMVNIWRDFPTFQPIAMIGGVIWASGNVFVVPIVKAIGLSKGLLLWGMSNTITGWASGKFGHLVIGLRKETVEYPVLNYLGVLVSVLSLVLYVFVDTKGGGIDKRGDDKDAAATSLLPSTNVAPSDEEEEEDDDEIWVDRLSPARKKLFGVTMSLVSGVMYGLNFDPPTWVKDNVEGASQDLIDYVFSHFTGILLAGIVYFTLYIIWTKNNPSVFPKAVAPAMLSGCMWAVAQSAWFVANNNLSLVVAFPLVSMGPGLVGALWGVFVFKEITGRKNYLVLIAAFFVAMAAAIMLVLSKKKL